MTTAPLVAEHACGRCGTPYRPPRWPRNYACGACGTPLRLTAAAPRPQLRLPSWLLGFLGVLLLAAAVIGAATGRALERRAARAAPPRTDEVALSARFPELVQEKLTLLRADLERFPSDPILLTRLAECYLFLAVYHRDTSPTRAEEMLAEARLLAQRLAGTPEGEQLEEDLAGWRGLRWTRSHSGTRATAMWGRPSLPPMPGMTSAPVPAPMRSVGGAQPGSESASTDSPSDQPLARPGNIPSYSTPGQAPQSTAPPAAPFQPAPLPAGPSLLTLMPRESPIDDRSPFAIRRRDERVEVLRRHLRQHPADAAAADELGRLKEISAETRQELARQEGRKNWPSAGTQDYEEAVRVYLAAAAQDGPRYRRAGFLVAAAGVYARQQRWEERYRILARAAELVPYSSQVWTELQGAALQTGRFRESRLARRRAAEWTFPGLRPL